MSRTDAPLLGADAASASSTWLEELATDSVVAGVAGPGRWLVVSYHPTALFSLKASTATSSVGKTLLLPTAYAIKMALVDAAFRSGLPDLECASLLQALTTMDVRVAPPQAAVVTHTFVKIRQELKVPNPLRPYGPSIAYREFVFHKGVWRWAFDLGLAGYSTAEHIAFLAPRINYIGKRGSFIQYAGIERTTQLSPHFALPLPGPNTTNTPSAASWHISTRWHAAILDDFGPEASLEVLSSFRKEGEPKPGKHRKWVHTLVPLGVVSHGPGFTEYRSDEWP